jgi:hypothetical protein
MNVAREIQSTLSNKGLPGLWSKNIQAIEAASDRDSLAATLKSIQQKYKSRLPAHIQSSVDIIGPGLNAFDSATMNNASTINGNNYNIINNNNNDDNNNLEEEISINNVNTNIPKSRRSSLSNFIPVRRPMTMAPKSTFRNLFRGGRRRRRRQTRRRSKVSQ